MNRRSWQPTCQRTIGIIPIDAQAQVIEPIHVSHAPTIERTTVRNRVRRKVGWALRILIKPWTKRTRSSLRFTSAQLNHRDVVVLAVGVVVAALGNVDIRHPSRSWGHLD